jgi:peroxiredoxin
VVAKKFAGKVTIVGVAWQGDDKSFQGFVNKHKLTFTNLADLDDSVYAHFGVPGQPAWVFVNSKGEAKKAVGVVPEATLEKVLTELT